MKKQLLFALICLFCQTEIMAQLPIPELPEVLKEKPPPPPVEQIFTIVECDPEFPDGNKQFQKWLLANLKHTKRVKRLIKANKLTLFFLINTDGAHSKLVGKGNVSAAMKRNLVTTFKKMPRFKPCRNSGRSFATWFRLDENLMCHAEKREPTTPRMNYNFYEETLHNFMIKKDGVYWQETIYVVKY